MITANEVNQMVSKLFSENISSDNELMEDISCIIYRRDAFECGDSAIYHRHIDIEFSFGEYREIHQDTPDFQFICRLCNLTLSGEEREIILYKKNQLPVC